MSCLILLLVEIYSPPSPPHSSVRKSRSKLKESLFGVGIFAGKITSYIINLNSF